MAVPPTNNKAFIGAYRKGRRARREGRALGACPYPDRRGGRYGEQVTFSRAFQNWWHAGWRDEALGQPETEQGGA